MSKRKDRYLIGAKNRWEIWGYESEAVLPMSKSELKREIKRSFGKWLDKMVVYELVPVKMGRKG